MTETAAVIPFAEGQASGLEELGGASPLRLNILTGPEGAMRLRPGIASWSLFPAAVPNASPVIGMCVWGEYLVYVTEDRKLWAWLSEGNVVALSDATALTQLDGGKRPTFCTTRTRILIAGGGAIQKWEGAGLSARLGGSPPIATHVVAVATRLIAAKYDNSGIQYWTPAGETSHETWNTSSADTGTGFAEAEARPDATVALHDVISEWFAFGKETTQVFVPDPVVGFSASQTVGVGCGAPYSVIQVDESFAWLDERRRFVTSDGRGFQVISAPDMTTTMAKFAVVSDCWGARCRIGAFDLLLWVFPTEGRTVYLEVSSKKWGEWCSFNTNGDRSPFVAQSYCYWPAKNTHLVGLNSGIISTLTFDAFTDSGALLKGVSRTGFEDHGSMTRKLCRRLQIQAKRGGTAQSGTEPAVEITYRDDLGAFRSPIRFGLGLAGDYKAVVDKFGLGFYRQRQWEMTLSQSTEYVITKAVETFEPLES